MEGVLYYINTIFIILNQFCLLYILENIGYHFSKTGKFSKAARHNTEKILNNFKFKYFQKSKFFFFFFLARMINFSRKSYGWLLSLIMNVKFEALMPITYLWQSRLQKGRDHHCCMKFCLFQLTSPRTAASKFIQPNTLLIWGLYTDPALFDSSLHTKTGCAVVPIFLNMQFRIIAKLTTPILNQLFIL